MLISIISLDKWLDLSWFSWSVLQQFVWENHYYLYAIPFVPILLVARWLFGVPFRQRVDISFPKKRVNTHWTTYLRFIPDIFLSIFLMLVLVSLARPQKVSEEVEKYSEGIDIMLTLDISESMRIEDLQPYRLQAAKEVAKSFIKGRFKDRIGIVIFAGDAFSLAPLTTDYELLSDFVNDIDFGIIRKSGTAIGSALAVATNRMRESDTKTKVIILLSDGENTAGNLDPITAAELAKFYNIKIYTILVGKKGRVPYGKDFFGNPNYIENSVSETTLREIARIGSGKFYRASDRRALQDVFKEISSLEKTKILELRSSYATDFYPVYLFWGLLAFVIWIWLKSTFMNNILED